MENAKAIHISPRLQGVVLSTKRCLEVEPERTTHYTILAEGFDGAFVTRFLTVVVEDVRDAEPSDLNMARVSAPWRYVRPLPRFPSTARD